MTSTFQGLIDETRQHLYSGSSDEMNWIAGSFGVSSTTLTLSYDLGSAARRGSIVSMGQERCLVQDFNVANKTLTVVRGYMSTPVLSTHVAGDMVLVNPRYDDYAIGRAINEDIVDMSSPANGLFQMLTFDITWSPVQEGYDLGLAYPPDILEIYELVWKMYGPSKNWPRITRYEMRRNMDISIFPSGNALMIYEPAFPGYPIHVQCKAGFHPFVNATDTTNGVASLSDDLIDIPPLGAAARLTAATEIRRNQVQTQGDTRRASEVPPGAAGKSAQMLMALRQSRIDAEKARLDQQYPIRRA